MPSVSSLMRPTLELPKERSLRRRSSWSESSSTSSKGNLLKRLWRSRSSLASERSCSSVTESESSSVEDWESQATLAERQGDLEQAAECYRKAYALSPHSNRILRLLIPLLLQLQQYTTAARYMARWDGPLLKEWLTQELLDALVDDREYTLALMVAQARPNQDSATVCRLYLLVAHEETRKRVALKHLEQCRRWAGDSCQWHWDLAYEYAQWQEYTVAKQLYQELLAEDDSDVAMVHYYQALYCHVPCKDWTAAQTCVRTSLQLEPDKAQFVQLQADIYFQMGKVDDCLNTYRRLLELAEPFERPKILYTMSRVCAKAKRHLQAMDFLKQELELTDDVLESSSILHELARAHERRGDYDSALKYYEKALQKLEHNVEEEDVRLAICETRKCLGRLHFQRGDLDRALRTSLVHPAAGGRKVK